jgi:hypothetical protein
VAHLLYVCNLFINKHSKYHKNRIKLRRDMLSSIEDIGLAFYYKSSDLYLQSDPNYVNYNTVGKEYSQFALLGKS